MKMRLAALALAAVACGSSSSPPVITSFKATPTTVDPGGASTLSWTVVNATALSIENGPAVQATDQSVVVHPTATTNYKLTATGAGGAKVVSDPVTVTVNASDPAPVVTSFGVSPSSVPTGGSATLSWAVTGKIVSIKLDPGGIDLKPETGANGAGTHTLSNITAGATYTLTVSNNGGSDAPTASVAVHSPQLQLNYTDPFRKGAAVQLVRNNTSTADALVLDLKVGDTALTAFGAALTIPFSDASAGMVTFSNASDLSLSGSPIHSSAATARGMLGGAGLGNAFSLGIARHKSAVGDGDESWPAGSVLGSITLHRSGSAAAGTSIFLGASPMSTLKFKAAIVHRDGSESSDIAIGDLIVSN